MAGLYREQFCLSKLDKDNGALWDFLVEEAKLNTYKQIILPKEQQIEYKLNAFYGAFT